MKRNAVMAKVPENALTALEGEAMLTLYEWNARVAPVPSINAFWIPATFSNSQESDP